MDHARGAAPSRQRALGVAAPLRDDMARSVRAENAKLEPALAFARVAPGAADDRADAVGSLDAEHVTLEDTCDAARHATLSATVPLSEVLGRHVP